MLDCKLEQNIARAEKDAVELTSSQAMGVVKTCIRTAPTLTGLETAGGTYESTTTRRFFKLQGRHGGGPVVTSVSDAFTQAIMAEDGGEEAVSVNRSALFERAAQERAV